MVNYTHVLFHSDETGQLPYLTHGLTTVTSLPSIIAYVANIKQENDAGDGPSKHSEPFDHVGRAQQIAWISYVQAQLGDLLVIMIMSYCILSH